MVSADLVVVRRLLVVVLYMIAGVFQSEFSAKLSTNVVNSDNDLLSKCEKQGLSCSTGAPLCGNPLSNRRFSLGQQRGAVVWFAEAKMCLANVRYYCRIFCFRQFCCRLFMDYFTTVVIYICHIIVV